MSLWAGNGMLLAKFYADSPLNFLCFGQCNDYSLHTFLPVEASYNNIYIRAHAWQSSGSVCVKQPYSLSLSFVSTATIQILIDQASYLYSLAYAHKDTRAPIIVHIDVRVECR